MSLFREPTEHAANPPETWQVVKISERRWALAIAGSADPVNNAGDRLDVFDSKRSAEQAREDGFMARLWRTEARWYAGGAVAGWKPYAEISGATA